MARVLWVVSGVLRHDTELLRARYAHGLAESQDLSVGVVDGLAHLDVVEQRLDLAARLGELRLRPALGVP